MRSKVRAKEEATALPSPDGAIHTACYETTKAAVASNEVATAA